MKTPRFLVRFAACFLAGAVLPLMVVGQEVLLRENFDSGWSTVQPPTGWRIRFSGDTSSNDWHRAPDLGRNPWFENITPYALIDSVGSESGSDSLLSPAFDCSQSPYVQLRCSTYCASGGIAPYEARLLGSVGGGRFEHLVFDYSNIAFGPGLQVFNLPWAAEQAQVRLAWVFAGDTRNFAFWAVDDITVIGSSTRRDVGVERILAPQGRIDSASAVVPKVLVENYGSGTESFSTCLLIGSSYQDSARVENLAAGATREVSFPPWNGAGRGNTGILGQTILSGDEDPTNDTATSLVFVRVLDVAPVDIVAPADTVDSGAVILPLVRVGNIGTDSSGACRCYFRAQTWQDSAPVPALAPGETRDIAFRSWTAPESGTVVVRASTGWVGDMNRTNDTVQKPVFIRSASFKDMAAVGILAPLELVRESTIVTPRAVARNNGGGAAQTTTYFTISREGETVFSDSLARYLPPRAVDTVVFNSWYATPEGEYETEFRVSLVDDMNPANDTFKSEFQVARSFHDIGVQEILAPLETIESGPVTPRARVKNCGSFTETFIVRLWIVKDTTQVYNEFTGVGGLLPESSHVVSFRPWNATPGQYTVRCSSELIGDMIPANNKLAASVKVESLLIPLGWLEMVNVPSAPSSKEVQQGGNLGLVDDGSYLWAYALKGYKTGDFYRYNIETNEWQQRPSVPLGPDEKQVYKGGSMCTDGWSTIYITKGNNTYEFLRYDVAADSWSQMAPVPEGPKRKKVKAGTSMQYVTDDDTGYCYLLKGSTSEFYRYSTQTRSWFTLKPAPSGRSGKAKFAGGSFLVYDNYRTMYCLKAKYNECFAYDVPGDSWRQRQLSDMPLQGRSGRKKKLKDGGCGVWLNHEMFCLKGGNTVEFWRYNPWKDSWKELDTVPSYGSTGKKKRVKYGADIVALPTGIFYALKGNKTFEFWRYRYDLSLGVFDEPRTLVQSLPGRCLAVRPSPARTRATIELPASGPAMLRLFDLCGKLVRSEVVQSASGKVNLELNALPPGVYFIRVDQDRLTRAAKLVIE